MLLPTLSDWGLEIRTATTKETSPTVSNYAAFREKQHGHLRTRECKAPEIPATRLQTFEVLVNLQELKALTSKRDP